MGCDSVRERSAGTFGGATTAEPLRKREPRARAKECCRRARSRVPGTSADRHAIAHMCMVGAHALQRTGDTFAGAGEPRRAAADENVPLLHRALALNDFPEVDSGLKSMWAFAGDTTRFIYQNNRTEFIEDAHKTAAQFSTSLYGSGMFGTWELETPLTYCGGNCADEAWVATCVVKTVSSDGRMRRWQWEPEAPAAAALGAWYVESVRQLGPEGRV